MILDCFYLKGLISLELKSWLSWLVISRGGFGMGFFGDSQSLIPIPGIADGDFSFRARSKNPRRFEIPGMGIGDWESPKIPSKKSPKNPQSRGWGFVIFVAEKSLIGISEKSPIFIRRDWGFLSPGFLPRDFSGMASRMGIFRERGFFLVRWISHQKATSGHK